MNRPDRKEKKKKLIQAIKRMAQAFSKAHLTLISYAQA